MYKSSTEQHDKVGKELAIFGGAPVRTQSWPKWPEADQRTEQYLLDVLYSGRWSIAGKFNGTPLYARRFSEAFAAYHSVAHCIPTVNGSAALVIALEALGIQTGDEVIVPGLAWVACASAVTRIGAIPVLVDIDLDTLCMSAEAARNAISSRTKAIMLVHSYCTVADLDAFVKLSEATGIPLLEDCSQAHGAIWKNRHVGSFGKIGIFSMGQSKILSCGEGGAAITDDANLYDRMQQFHADGYRYKNSPPIVGEGELEAFDLIQGHNYCISEFHAAILLDRLDHLDQQNRVREQNGEYLRKLLSGIDSIIPLFRHPNVDSLTYFRFCVRLDLKVFGGANIEQIRKALVAELNETSIELVDNPLNTYDFYKPPHVLGTDFESTEILLPAATQASEQCVTFHHAMLLAGKNDVEDIAAAFAKLIQYKEALAYV